MRLSVFITATAAIFASAAAMPAHAASVAPAPQAAFATTPLSDDALSVIRGGQGTPALTRRTFAALYDSDTRAFDRTTNSIALTSMNIWFDTVGASMIAANLRASGM